MTSGWNTWRHLDPRTPVIVGVGRATQDAGPPQERSDALGLMIAAATAAGSDSGGALLGDVDRVAVPVGSWGHRDAGRLVARAVGADRARTVGLEAGISQQTLFDDAFVDLLAGRIDTALIVGGEAAARAAAARRGGIVLDDTVAGDDRDPDDHRRPEGEIVSSVEIAAGLYDPAQQYALMDSALRGAEGRTIAQHRDEIAALMADFSAVAGRSAHAAHPIERTAAWIREPGPENRPISFPYNKWHCSQLHVDQSAAILLSTLAAAEEAGVDPDRVVFPVVALESSHALAVLRRRDLHRWPAMDLLGRAAEAHLGRPLAAIDHVEVYSCFPAAVRIQQRALRLSVDGVPTITGGEPFGGGPWNNFVLQATVAMVERLRNHRGELGLVTTVSGFLHKPGLAVYTTTPPPRPLLVADLARQVAAATPALPIVDSHQGPAVVDAITVSHERSGDQRTIVIARTPAGERCIATSTDPSIAASATTRELIGVEVGVDDMDLRL